jgi:hypothetical protein
MEESAEYDRSSIGKIPRNARIQITYNIIGSTMALLGETNAMIAKVLNGEKVDVWNARANLQSVQQMCDVISRTLDNETFDFNKVPF